ncbi:MAG TPA: Tn3 family transposase [Candidatus Methylomirabilis sp.]
MPFYARGFSPTGGNVSQPRKQRPSPLHSIKHRTAKAHDVMQRLVSSAPVDRLAKALTALGRLVKTTYILRYIADPALRGAVHLQFNRDEARHALARRLFFAELGEFLRGDYEEIMKGSFGEMDLSSAGHKSVS